MSRPKLAVMLVNGRGDYLLNLPALRALSSCFGEDAVLITGQDAHERLFPDLRFARSIALESHRSAAGPEFNAAELAARIGAVEIFLSLNPWHTPSMAALLDCMPCTRSIGYFPRFDTEIPLDFSKHSADLAFDAVRILVPEARIETYAGPPRFQPRDEALAAAIYSELGAARPLIGLHNETLAAKTWPAHCTRELVAALHAEWPGAIVLDLGLGPVLGAVANQPDHYLHLNGLVLPAAFALVQHLDLLVGADSCMLHAADLYRTPAVGLFGPTDVHEFGLRFGGPGTHVCAASMAEISVAAVLGAVRSLSVECFARGVS